MAVTFADLAPLLGALLGGGILGAVSQWRKSGAERDSIVATATKSAIEVFKESITQLKEDLAEASAEADALRRELAAAREDVANLVVRKNELEIEVSRLRARVIELESQLG